MDFMKIVAEKAKQGILICDRRLLKITYANNSISKILGISRDKIIGTDLDSCFDCLEVGSKKELLDKVKEKGRACQIRILKNENIFFHYDVHIVRSRDYIIFFFDDVSSYHKKIAELDISVNKFKGLVQNINDIIFSCDVMGNLTFVSKNVRKIGYTEKEAIGKSILSFIHPEDRKRVETEMMSTFSDLKESISVMRLVKKDGSYIYVEDFSKIIVNDGKIIGLSGVLRDITERVVAQEKKKRDQENIEKLLNFMGDMIIVTHKDGKIVFYNDVVIDNLYYGSSKLDEMSIFDLFDRGKEMLKNAADGVICHEIDCIMNHMKKKDGTSFPVEAKITNGIWYDDEVLIWILRDLSELENMRYELKEKAEIKMLLKKKTEFVSQISHDMRTPLTPIITMSSILKMKFTDPEDQKRLDVIKRNAEYLKELVESTLSLARYDLGISRLNMGVIDCHDFFAEIINMNAISFNSHNIRIRNNVKKGISLSCDLLRMKEVFLNLTMNSLKFMDDGGHLDFGCKENDNSITLYTKDDGIGLAEKELNIVFEPFYKVDQSRHEHSYGLGLSIAKRIVEMHKGKIWAESDGKGKGTAFYVRLPKID